MPFEVRKVPARPLQQVFLHDPDGIMIELNFWHEADVPEIEKTGKPCPSRPRSRRQEAAVGASSMLDGPRASGSLRS